MLETSLVRPRPNPSVCALQPILLRPNLPPRRINFLATPVFVSICVRHNARAKCERVMHPRIGGWCCSGKLVVDCCSLCWVYSAMALKLHLHHFGTTLLLSSLLTPAFFNISISLMLYNSSPFGHFCLCQNRNTKLKHLSWRRLVVSGSSS